jgi:hypothetical protein
VFLICRLSRALGTRDHQSEMSYSGYNAMVVLLFAKDVVGTLTHTGASPEQVSHCVGHMIASRNERDFRDSRHPTHVRCAFLGYYAAYSGNSLQTFRDNISVPSLRRDR